MTIYKTKLKNESCLKVVIVDRSRGGARKVKMGVIITKIKNASIKYEQQIMKME